MTTDNADVENQLATAIMTKFNALIDGEHNAFWIALNGKLFDGDASGNDFPYSCFWFLPGNDDPTFTEEIKDHLIQFDFFSSVSAADARRLRFLAMQLFHEKSLTMTGSTVVWIRGQNVSGGSIPEDMPTQDAGNKVWHAIAEYEVKTSLN
jgi:hypothetical protein